LFAQTKYKEAAELAAESPQGLLRTPETVAKFQENNAWLGLKMLISQGLKQLGIASVAINLVQFSYTNLVRLSTPLLLEDDESKSRGSVVSPAQLVLLFCPA